MVVSVSLSTVFVCVYVGSNPCLDTAQIRLLVKKECSIILHCDVKSGCHRIGQYCQGMTQRCCCSHPIQMPHKGAGVLVLLVHSHEQLTPPPLGLYFSNDHILHQEQCYEQMPRPLAVMHQTLGLMPTNLDNV